MHYLIFDLRSEASSQVSLLNPSQLDPTERAAYASRGERYLLERSLLRRELARLLNIAPEQVRISYSPSGKPLCAEQPFSLSHSGDLLAFAFHHRAVGIDIQRVHPVPRMVSVAKRIFSPPQWELWQERGASQGDFFSSWCIAESLVKLVGGSIHSAARDCPFLFDGTSVQPLLSPKPMVEVFSPAPGYAGAVAYHTTRIPIKSTVEQTIDD